MQVALQELLFIAEIVPITEELTIIFVLEPYHYKNLEGIEYESNALHYLDHCPSRPC